MTETLKVNFHVPPYFIFSGHVHDYENAVDMSSFFTKFELCHFQEFGHMLGSPYRVKISQSLQSLKSNKGKVIKNQGWGHKISAR